MTWQETIGFLTGCMPRPGVTGAGAAGRRAAYARSVCVREERCAFLRRRGRSPAPVHLPSRRWSRWRRRCASTPFMPVLRSSARALSPCAADTAWACAGGSWRRGRACALCATSAPCACVWRGQWRGAADVLMPHLWDEQGRVRSLLIVGLPGMGKTTMLRDACRRLSERGARMCVVDERSEIAAMSGGVPQLDVGPNTDVLDGCAKEAGLRWMLRAMSPQALVTDELGGAMDAQAVLDAARSGCERAGHAAWARPAGGAVARNPLSSGAEPRL